MRQSRRALTRDRKTRWKFVETVDARDLFDQIDFAFDFRAPRRLRAFPCGEQRAFGAAILVDANGRESQRAESRLDFLVGNVRTHHAKNLGTRDANFLRRALARINIDDASEQFPAGKLQDQFCQRREAISAISGSPPRPNRVEASV